MSTLTGMGKPELNVESAGMDIYVMGQIAGLVNGEVNCTFTIGAFQPSGSLLFEDWLLTSRGILRVLTRPWGLAKSVMISPWKGGTEGHVFGR